MSIQPIQALPGSTSNGIDNSKQIKNTPNLMMDSDSRQILDKATGLLQTIVKERTGDKIIRKIPQDEYLELLTLLDDIVSGTIDKQV